jgi:hypothetical protein
MRAAHLPLGLLLLGAAACSRVDGHSAKAPLHLQGDLEKLRGTWEPAQPVVAAGSISLEFDKDARDGQDYVAVHHTRGGGGNMLDVASAVARFTLKEADGKRVITPVKNGDKVSAITYRFEGDTLVIEEGECDTHSRVSLKGRWTSRKGERAP